MISLNAYSLAYSMGLLRKKNKRSWKLIDFIKFCKNKKIDFLEFPIDYFSNKEKTSLKKIFLILEKEKIQPIIDLENINLNVIKQLVHLNKEFKFDLIRIKMSNYFSGNRHEIRDFDKTKRNFVINIKKILKIIKKTSLQIAIENHQDLTSKEIIKIIKSTSVEKVGVNWDMGNSLATAEIPEKFFENVKKYIFNVHSKDYRVVRSSEGFFLKRCIVGKGIIDFKKFIKFFKKKGINLSVELGAHYSRHCKLNNPAFLKAHEIDNKRLSTFNEYLKQISVQENPFTDWEIFKDEKNCYAEEIKDVNKSIEFIKKLYV